MTEINATPAESMKDRPVKVKMSKLTEGIGIVFIGVMTMLEALDASSARKLIDTLKPENEGDAPVNPAADDTSEEKADRGLTGAADSDDSADATTDTTTDATADASAVGTGEEVKAGGTAEQKETAAQMASAAPKTQTAPTVTVDDITKIIVQKIKKNRSNNERIGAILKSYSVSKVSDLPKDKYESFLTDLSQL